MSQTIGAVRVNYGADFRQLSAQLTRLQGRVDRQSRRMSRSYRAVNGTLNTLRRGLRLMGGLIAGLSVAGLVRLSRQALQTSGEIVNIADRLGVGTEALQEFRFAAEQVGLAQAGIDVGLQRFARRVAAAIDGTGQLAAIFTRSEIATIAATEGTRQLEVALDIYADKVRDAATQNERIALTYAALDTEGVGFVAALQDGAAGLRRLRDEARATNQVIDDESLRSAADLDEQYTNLSKSISNDLTRAFINLGPIIVGGARLFNTLTGSVSRAVTQFNLLRARRGGDISGLTDEQLTNETVRNTEKLVMARQARARALRDLDAANEAANEGGFFRRFLQIFNTTADDAQSRLDDANRLITQLEAQDKRILALLRKRNIVPPPEDPPPEGNFLTDFFKNIDENSEAVRSLNALTKEFTTGLGQGLAAAVIEGKKLSDVFDNLAKRLASRAFTRLFDILLNAGLAAAGAPGFTNPFAAPPVAGQAARGGGIVGGRPGSALRGLPQFQDGGIVGTDIGGRARLVVAHDGEAILTQDETRALLDDGEARPSGGTQITINIETPNVEGFRRSQSQIAAQIQRAISVGNRNG